MKTVIMIDYLSKAIQSGLTVVVAAMPPKNMALSLKIFKRHFQSFIPHHSRQSSS